MEIATILWQPKSCSNYLSIEFWPSCSSLSSAHEQINIPYVHGYASIQSWLFNHCLRFNLQINGRWGETWKNLIGMSGYSSFLVHSVEISLATFRNDNLLFKQAGYQQRAHQVVCSLVLSGAQFLNRTQVFICDKCVTWPAYRLFFLDITARKSFHPGDILTVNFTYGLKSVKTHCLSHVIFQKYK